MNYKDEVHNFIKNNPGCRSHELWDHIDNIVKTEYNKKSNFGKWIADLPFGTGRHANLTRILRSASDLTKAGLITRQTDPDGRDKHFPA